MRKAKRHFAENFLCRNVINSGLRSFNREIADFNRQGHFALILFWRIVLSFLRFFLQVCFLFGAFRFFARKFSAHIFSLEFSEMVGFIGKSLENTTKSTLGFSEPLLEHNCYYVNRSINHENAGVYTVFHTLKQENT